MSLFQEQQAADPTTSTEELWELAFKYPELDRIIAQNPNIDPELLQEFLLSDDQLILQGVATNPNTPADVLLKLGAEFPEELLRSSAFANLFLSNPNLVAEIPLKTLQSIVQHFHLPIQFRIELALRTSDQTYLFELLKNPNLPLEILEKLFKRSERSVGGVAESAGLHVNWPSDRHIIRENYDDFDQELRAYAGAYSRNDKHRAAWVALGLIPEGLLKSGGHEGYLIAASAPNISSELLAELSAPYLRGNQEYYLVMKALARNPKTPAAVLKKLWQLEKETWENLKSGPNQAYDLSSVKFAQELFNEVGFSPALAGNPNTPLVVLQELSQSLETETMQVLLETANVLDASRISLAQNPNTPAELLAKLWIDPSPSVHIALLQNSQTASDELEVAAQHSAVKVRMHVAKQIDTPPHILATLAVDTSPTVVVAALNNPKLPMEVLQHIMATESASASNLIAIATKTYWSRVSELSHSCLEQIEAQDINCLIGIARNPNTSAPMLAKLANLIEDQYEAVRNVD